MTSEFWQFSVVIYWLQKRLKCVLVMTLKLLFFAAKSQKLPASEGSARPVCDTIELHQFVQDEAGLNFTIFRAKKFTFDSSPLRKILVELLVAFTADAERFFEQLCTST